MGKLSNSLKECLGSILMVSMQTRGPGPRTHIHADAKFLTSYKI